MTALLMEHLMPGDVVSFQGITALVTGIDTVSQEVHLLGQACEAGGVGSFQIEYEWDDTVEVVVSSSNL
jgi:hypothetical protein